MPVQKVTNTKVTSVLQPLNFLASLYWLMSYPLLETNDPFDSCTKESLFIHSYFTFNPHFTCSLGYIQTYAYTHFDLIFADVMVALHWLHGSRATPSTKFGCVGLRDRWMNGQMTPVSNPTGERKSLSEHNRKETEQKQELVFLDIKSLPVGLWAASSTVLSHKLSAQFNHPFSRKRNWSSPLTCVHLKCTGSCRSVL